MTRSEMSSQIREVLRQTAPFADAAIASSTSLTDELGYDSLGLWELMLLLEETFQLSASDDELVDVQSVADIEALVWAKLTVAAPAAETP
jgi:acyl carrier protein